MKHCYKKDTFFTTQLNLNPLVLSLFRIHTKNSQKNLYCRRFHLNVLLLCQRSVFSPNKQTFDPWKMRNQAVIIWFFVPHKNILFFFTTGSMQHPPNSSFLQNKHSGFAPEPKQKLHMGFFLFCNTCIEMNRLLHESYENMLCGITYYFSMMPVCFIFTFNVPLQHTFLFLF